ncbi:hypothetical protein Patl1_19183 [Pistacia atlantica]|uniref:Uncharacterized protein n=1 Tax=Pistacia atlantica TaxID=434234 RepID=A0ACC1C2V4_9ROSI|nr:hypothetical protein Patl1_19183 [Pistacia atlantica]
MSKTLLNSGRPIFFYYGNGDNKTLQLGPQKLEIVGEPLEILVNGDNWESMTSRADQNGKWASYAGPGGWNGN